MVAHHFVEMEHSDEFKMFCLVGYGKQDPHNGQLYEKRRSWAQCVLSVLGMRSLFLII